MAARRQSPGDVEATATPLFTVVITTYNRASLLPRAIESVLRQTLTDFELIVVDDGSTDETETVVRRYDDPRLHYIWQENAGLSRARNHGAANGTGKYLVFLDDDDEATPGWLGAFAQRLTGARCGLVCCGAVYVIGRDRKEIVARPRNLGPVYENQVGFFLAGTFAVRHDIYEVVGGFTLPQPALHTTELMFRLLPYLVEHDWRIESIDAPLVRIFRSDPEGRARQLAGSQLAATYRLIERSGDRLARDPRILADYYAVAGVNEARLGRYSMARADFRRAIRAYPWRVKHLARLVLAFVPAVARRVW